RTCAGPASWSGGPAPTGCTSGTPSPIHRWTWPRSPRHDGRPRCGGRCGGFTRLRLDTTRLPGLLPHDVFPLAGTAARHGCTRGHRWRTLRVVQPALHQDLADELWEADRS